MSARVGFRRYIHEILTCRLCRHVAFLVLISILLIEGAILVPSYLNYERDLLLRLEQVGGAIVSAAMRGKGHHGDRKIMNAARLMLASEEFAGGAVYRLDGKPIGTFGEASELTAESIANSTTGGILEGTVIRRRSEDGRRYAVLYPGETSRLPFAVVANLRADWIAGELTAFLWRIIGPVLLITGFVTMATMAVIGHFVLSPLLHLRDHLNAAAVDPENSVTLPLGDAREDELGEVMGQFDSLLQKVSAIQRSDRERLAAMVDNSANGVFAVEPDGRYIYANRAALDLAKIDHIDQLNYGSRTLVVTSKGREMPLSRYLLAGERTGEVELIDAHGRRIVCMLGVNRLPGRNGVASLNYGWAIDITERRKGEEALVRAVEESKVANRAKTEFLANMSHELRTPLNAIVGFSEVIKDEMFGPLLQQKYRDYVGDIHDSGEHLLSIINDILDLSRIEAGVTTLMEDEVDIAALIADSSRIAQGRTDSGRANILHHIAVGLPRLVCDSRLLKQVLLNILSNALKFTPYHGDVTITAWRDDFGGLEIKVSDSGIGIPADRINDVLLPFTQIEDSYVRRHEGAGLGLPLSKQFVELHGGSLIIESTEGHGTAVTIRLPKERLGGQDDAGPAIAVS